MLGLTSRKAEMVKEGITPVKVLLVTQTQATLEAFSGLSVILATTAFSAANKAVIENPLMIIWDLGGPPLETEIPTYVWHQDINTVNDVISLLKQLHPDPPQNQSSFNKKNRDQLVILPSCEDLPLKSFKNKYLVDVSGEFSKGVEINQDNLWRADWRLGIDAKPLRIDGVYLFAQTDCLGPVDELDQTRFIDFIEALLEKNKPVYVIDSGRWREELLRLGAVIMEGGF